MPNLFRPIEYLTPRTIPETISLLANHGQEAAIVGGGTMLFVERPSRVKVLIDISLLNLDYIQPVPEGVRIGAMTTLAQLQKSSLLQDSPWNIILEALRKVGSSQVRNVATIGGAICSADPALDTVPPLIALNGKATVQGPKGIKQLDLQNFLRGEGQNILERGEMLTEVFILTPPAGTAGAFQKIGLKPYDRPLVNTAVTLRLRGDGKTCEDTRIVIGGIASTFLRARKAEEILRGKILNDGIIEESAKIASEEGSPKNDWRASGEYRRTLSFVLVKRALTVAYKGGGVV